MFQFQDGAIIRKLNRIQMNLGNQFQFQDGAIIRIFFQSHKYNKMKFQFQDGAIIREYRLRTLFMMQSFNSKMVRL